MNDHCAQFTVEAVPRGVRLSAVAISVPGQEPWSDEVNLQSSAQRAKFEEAAVERFPGLPREQLTTRMEALSAAEFKRAGGQGIDEDADQSDSQATALVKLAQSNGELFHSAGSASGDAYISVEFKTHRETFGLKSEGFKDWLSREFFLREDTAPRSQAISEAITVLRGIATHDGPEHEVGLRIAGHEDVIYVDLANEQHQVVEISRTGVSLKRNNEVPVRFANRQGTLPLPAPVSGGSIEELRPLLNLADDHSWRQFVGYLVGSMNPKGPYCILIVNGEHGSSKSTLSKIARSVIDPAKPMLRRPPRSEQDLAIAASNRRVLAFDNLSGLNPELSDSFCTLATGGGFAARALYTDGDEKLFEYTRPVIINGIDGLTERPDLLDRSIHLLLEPIPDQAIKQEKLLWAEFDAVLPRVLGALFEAVSCALRCRDAAELPRKTRMADFATFVTAAEEGLGWAPGTFIRDFTASRNAADLAGIDSSPIGPALLEFIDSGSGAWDGTTAELLDGLNGCVSDAEGKARDWPRTPQKLARALRRIAPNVRRLGWKLEFGGQAGKKRRLVTISKAAMQPSVEPVAPMSDSVADDELSGPVRLGDGLEREGASTPTAKNALPGPVSGDWYEGYDWDVSLQKTIFAGGLPLPIPQVKEREGSNGLLLTEDMSSGEETYQTSETYQAPLDGSAGPIAGGRLADTERTEGGDKRTEASDEEVTTGTPRNEGTFQPELAEQWNGQTHAGSSRCNDKPEPACLPWRDES